MEARLQGSRKTNNSRIRGYVAMITLIAVGAVSLAATMVILITGITASLTSEAVRESAEARGFADACGETALEAIRQDPDYTGTGGLTFGDTGSCSYTVTGASPTKTVTASGTSNNATRKINITTLQVFPTIQIGSWQEVAD